MHAFSIRRLLLTFTLALAASAARADIQISGDRLTIGSTTLQLSFKAGDLVRIKNRFTGEDFVRTTTPQPWALDMGMIRPPNLPYRNFGWQQGRPDVNPDSAQIQFNDQTRSIWMRVIVDHETNDITVALWGEANREGVTGLTWGVRGLDLTGGKFIIPAQGGRYYDATVGPNEVSYAYPGDWQAQMAIWQTKTGGFVVYSRDDAARYKKFSITRKGSFADMMLETEAEAPFEGASGVPQVEWRFNAYKGDWKVPASGYRNLMQFYRQPAKIPPARQWVRNIRSVVTIRGPRQDPKLIDALAKQVDPAKTLLYIPDWRHDEMDVNYPDYDWNETIREFVEKAHDAGFHVMLHTDLTAVSPTNPEYARLRKFQVCDARMGKPIGRRWEHADSDPKRFAIINPAAEAWRAVFLNRVRQVVDEVQPDALFLAGAGTLLNDGNSQLPKRNFAEGCMALERALLTAYPKLALGVDGLNELTGPYCWFAARKGEPGLPPHPISEYLFGDHVVTFSHPDLPEADIAPGAWAKRLGVLEGQGVLPTAVVSSEADFAKPGVRQALDIARLWQSREFSPMWAADWGNSRFIWKDQEGVPAAVETTPAGTRLRVGNDTVTRRISGVPNVVTPDRIPGWPGYDENELHGLSPSRSYLAVAGPRNRDALHIPVVGAGAVIDWAQITPEFALIGLAPANKAAAAPVAMEVALPPGVSAAATTGSAGEPISKDGRLVWSAVAPVGWVAIFLKTPADAKPGQDLIAVEHDDSAVSSGIANPLPLGKPAAVSCGKVEKTGLLAVPPSGAIRVHTWALKLPESAASLSLQAGIADNTSGEGVDFEARVNGETVWKTGRTESGWEEGHADLSRWKGKPVVLQLITKSRSEFGGDRAAWAEVVVK